MAAGAARKNPSSLLDEDGNSSSSDVGVMLRETSDANEENVEVDGPRDRESSGGGCL